MTGSEVAQIITAVSALIAACGSTAALIQSARNGRKVVKISEQVSDIKEQTDGINAKLVKVTGEAKYAEGVKHGEDHPRDEVVQKVEIVKIPPIPPGT